MCLLPLPRLSSLDPHDRQPKHRKIPKIPGGSKISLLGEDFVSKQSTSVLRNSRNYGLQTKHSKDQHESPVGSGAMGSRLPNIGHRASKGHRALSSRRPSRILRSVTRQGKSIHAAGASARQQAVTATGAYVEAWYPSLHPASRSAYLNGSAGAPPLLLFTTNALVCS